jgi:hypothetical protein
MRGHPKYEAIERLLLALPVRQENTCLVEFFVAELCLRGDILAKSGGDGKAPRNFRPASIATVKKELREFRERTRGLAEKIRKGGHTTRAREQLAKLVESLHRPTIEALGNVEPCACRGISDTHALTSKLPLRLSRAGVSDAELSFWSVIAADALYELTPRPPTDPVPDLPLWLIEALGEKLSPITRCDEDPAKSGSKAGTDHRPVNKGVIAIAHLLARAVHVLTGRRPPAATNGVKTARHEAYVGLVREIFAELNVHEADASYYAGKGARALPKKGKKGGASLNYPA